MLTLNRRLSRTSVIDTPCLSCNLQTAKYLIMTTRTRYLNAWMIVMPYPWRPDQLPGVFMDFDSDVVALADTIGVLGVAGAWRWKMVLPRTTFRMWTHLRLCPSMLPVTENPRRGQPRYDTTLERRPWRRRPLSRFRPAHLPKSLVENGLHAFQNRQWWTPRLPAGWDPGARKTSCTVVYRNQERNLKCSTGFTAPKLSYIGTSTPIEAAIAAERPRIKVHHQKDKTIPRTEKQQQCMIRGLCQCMHRTDVAEDNPGMIRRGKKPRQGCWTQKPCLYCCEEC